MSAAGGRTLGRGGRVGLAGRTPGELLQRRGRFWSVARRVSAYVGAAPSRPRGRSGPVPKPPRRRSASGAPLGTRYVRSSSAVPHWNVRAAVTPETPLRTGPVGRRGRRAAPFVGTARASLERRAPRTGAASAPPPPPPSDSTVDAKDRAELARQPPQRAGPRGRRAYSKYRGARAERLTHDAARDHAGRRRAAVHARGPAVTGRSARSPGPDLSWRRRPKSSKGMRAAAPSARESK